MGFVTPALLGGALLIGLPIVLHLIMRREAKHFLFPALRFVQRRQTLNQHRLRLRHWLLLALRCAIIALLAFALARPVLRGSALAGKEDRPIATALVFDNSLRMQYEHENKSRLDEAKELASWLIGQMPPDSPVTVVDRVGKHRGSDTDRDAAELRVERLSTSAATRSLGETLRDAADWLGEREDHRGEIYVFTDLAAAAWTDEVLADFKARLDELPGTHVYLIDVGVEEARNIGLGPLRLSNQQLAPGGLLEIETELWAAGKNAKGGSDADDAYDAESAPSVSENSTGDTPSTEKISSVDSLAFTDGREVAVELHLIDGISEPVNRGQELVRPIAGKPAPIDFSLAGLPLGTHQGYLRVVGDDALSFDDVRYFTVEVRPPSKVLLLGETAEDTLFLHEALAPSTAAGLVEPKFTCQAATFADWQTLQLAEYDAICLVDPPPVAGEIWQELADFAHAGGGVGVFLGRHARADDFNQAAPQALLPARLRWVAREETYLRPVAVEHPALAELADFADTVPWSVFPVFKYWELEAGSGAAHVVATFGNGHPALVERVIGSGRVLTMTTSVSDPAYDDPWNLLPTGDDPWPFLVLASGIAEYLSGMTDAQLNYLAGRSVLLRLAPEEQTMSYVLSMPGASAVRQSLTPGQQDLSIASTEALGNYRVQAGGEQGRLDRGFSVNAPAELSRLERIAPDRIAEALGTERVRVARTQEEIEVRVGLGRLGRELFPTLIVVLALVLGAEQLLANRFYRTVGATSRAAQH